jgi:energy-coupling factor transporter ATP-binding protein EcfA2
MLHLTKNENLSLHFRPIMSDKDEGTKNETSVPMCTVCEDEKSGNFCSSCLKYFCEECWSFTHKKGEKKTHEKKNIQELMKEAIEFKYKVGKTVLETVKEKNEILTKSLNEAKEVLEKCKNDLSEDFKEELKNIIQSCQNNKEKSQILIMGQTSSGKTTLINWLLGETIGIVKAEKATSFISYYNQQKPEINGNILVEETFDKNNKIMKQFFISEKKSASQVFKERENYIEEYLENENKDKWNLERIDHSNIYVKSDLLDYIEIIDSPGLGKEEEDYNDNKTLEIAERASIVFYIMGHLYNLQDIQHIHKLMPRMKNNQLILLFNSLDIPIEKDKISYEKARQTRIDWICSHLTQFKDENFQKSLIFTISLEKLKTPWLNENKIYEKLGNEFQQVKHLRC